MTTKPAASVNPAAAESRERIAYDSVATIATVEPNDRVRLGYHVWRWLHARQGTLEEAVRESGARLRTNVDDAVRQIREHLDSKGLA